MPKISELLHQTKTGQLQVPKFQRGWVWNNKKVLELFRSLYRDYPVGSLIVWPTTLEEGRHVDSVIDGQQRLTALYNVIYGEPPPWSRDVLPESLNNLMFNVHTEEFKYRVSAMSEELIWVSVTELFTKGHPWWSTEYGYQFTTSARIHDYHENIARLLAIRDRSLNVEKLPADVPPETAAEVFKIVNRAGTRVSEGDLVLGQLSLRWEEARERINEVLVFWRSKGYGISLEWVLHAMSACLGGRINFEEVLSADLENIVASFERVERATSEVLDQLRDNLGLDSTTTTAINNGLIVVVAERLGRDGSADARDKLDRAMIGWWLLSTVHNRWSADVRNRTNRDLNIVSLGNGVDGLLQELRPMVRTRSLRLNAADFECVRSSKPYYRLLLTLARRCGARDLRSGVSLSFHQTSHLSRLDAHHIFPRRYLSNVGVEKAKIDQLANLAFITQGTNLGIGAKPPADYLPKFEETHPGVLASQWIPEDPALWRVGAYPRFLQRRRKLLADVANEFLQELIGEEL